MSENALQSLNLKQKRYIQQHKESPDFINFHEKINKIVDGKIEVQFDWNSIAQGLLADTYENMFLNSGNNIKEWFLQHCEEGIKKVCTDSLSKEAFRNKVKIIKFAHAIEPNISLENGILTLASNLHGGGCMSDSSINDFLINRL